MRKLIFKPAEIGEKSIESATADRIKVIIADDEPEMHAVTRFVLKDYEYQGKKLEFLSAYSGEEAKQLLSDNPDTSLILLDIVMESDDAGLEVSEFIRENLRNKLIRIILRTGQPGIAPEEEVIARYDVNDYKEKTELTGRKFMTAVTLALRSYADIYTIDSFRAVLEREVQTRTEELQQKNLEFEQMNKALERRAAEIAALNVELAKKAREADAGNRAKGEFLANMSHEIRTPLSIIIGLGNYLRQKMRDPALEQRLGQLCSTADHLLAMLNDILDLSKLDAGHVVLHEDNFRVGAVLDKVANLIGNLACEAGLMLEVAAAPALREVALRGDALRLAQVLINLGGNAVKFTERGSVCLSVVAIQETATHLRLAFAVRDTGIGIAREDQKRLFLAFEQADNPDACAQGGTGLGLAISQKLVALMGGTIRLDSRPQAGSTFSFELTLPRAEGFADDPVSLSAPPNFAGARVLVAEDHPINQEIILDLLESLGCEADIAGDGAEALECARANAYDLILMDVRMPRVDGFTATRAIRDLPQHRTTPILAVTASAFSEDRQHCVDAGMNGYIGKPFTTSTLAAGLRQWLPDLAAGSRDVPGLALHAIPDLDAPCRIRISATPRVGSASSLLHRYAESQEHDMERLRRHLAAGDRDAACDIAHKLKGVSGFIGVKSIAALASEIDAALRAGAQADSLEPMTARCAADLASLAAAVRALPPEGVAECIDCPSAFAKVAFCSRAAIGGLNGG